MPTLSQRVDFSLEELRAAISGQAIAMKKDVPLGRIQAVAFDQADPKKIMVELANDDTLRKKFVRMDLSFVAAALIRLCKNHEITIDRRDQVTVECKENKICMNAPV